MVRAAVATLFDATHLHGLHEKLRAVVLALGCKDCRIAVDALSIILALMHTCLRRRAVALHRALLAVWGSRGAPDAGAPDAVGHKINRLLVSGQHHQKVQHHDEKEGWGACVYKVRRAGRGWVTA